MDAASLFTKNFSNVAFEDIPEAVVAITKKEILDTLGVAVAGFAQPGAKELLEMVSDWGGKAESSIIGSKLKVPAPHAAQVNATMAHTRDYDDVHETAVMHPGLVTIMPALAMAELTGGLSGKELIAAVALGVDMICRLGLATRPGISPIQTGWHFTTLYGYPTAALTAGRILKLDEEKMLNAFGIAYHQCSGNGQCVTDGALTKRMGPGFAVRGGMTAALMAAKGITGAKNSLEGEQGLYQVYHQGQYDRDILTHDLGRHFEGINVSLKPYPCCRGIHASIDAALAVATKHRIKATDIKDILIATGEANHRLLCTPFAAKVRPRNPVDAQFSIPWGIAAALLKGGVTVADYTPDAIANREMLGLTAKIRTEADSTLNSARGVEPARVTIAMNNGETFSAQVDRATGSPAQPMSFEDCIGKFKDCTSLAGDWMPERNVEQAIELVATLENVKDIRELIQLFR